MFSNSLDGRSSWSVMGSCKLSFLLNDQFNIIEKAGSVFFLFVIDCGFIIYLNNIKYLLYACISQSYVQHVQGALTHLTANFWCVF